MPIFVNTVDGCTIRLEVEPSVTVEHAKALIYDQKRFPPHMQVLIFSGKRMDNDRRLSDYSVENGSTLHLIVRCDACFVAATMIRLADGSDLPIKDVRKGMRVQSWDVNQATAVVGSVSQTFEHTDNQVVTIGTRDGHVTCTPGMTNNLVVVWARFCNVQSVRPCHPSMPSIHPSTDIHTHPSILIVAATERTFDWLD